MACLAPYCDHSFPRCKQMSTLALSPLPLLRVMADLTRKCTKVIMNHTVLIYSQDHHLRCPSGLRMAVMMCPPYLLPTNQTRIPCPTEALKIPSQDQSQLQGLLSGKKPVRQLICKCWKTDFYVGTATRMSPTSQKWSRRQQDKMLASMRMRDASHIARSRMVALGFIHQVSAGKILTRTTALEPMDIT